MMSEDIHKWSDGRYTLMFDEHTFFVFDNEKEERMTALKTTKRLNEQQAIIDKQELRLQQLEELLELSENLNKSYREKLIDMNLKMMIDDE